MREAGLEKHAAALQGCVEMFGAALSGRQRGAPQGLVLREAMDILAKLRSAAFEKATGEVDDGAIEPAMVKLAREAGILP